MAESKEKNGILTFLQGKKGRWLTAFLGILGVALLLFGSNLGKVGAVGSGEKALKEAEAYRAAFTREVQALCEGVEGVGRAKVLLTFSNSSLAIYEKDESERGKSVVKLGGEALLLGYQVPKVTGAAVVCDGGGDPRVQMELTGLLRALCGLSSDKIHISQAG